jgi:NADP-dependent 3-hydroxy acid dehydrogenase YdfG
LVPWVFSRTSWRPERAEAFALERQLAHEIGEACRDEIGALPPGDIAAAIAFAVAAPPRVNVAELIVMPTTQG